MKKQLNKINDNNSTNNKSFGLLFFFVFFIIYLYQYLNSNYLNWYVLLIGIIFLILGILNSKFLTPLKLSWIKLGFLLGKLVSPIILGVIFFLIVTPTSFLLKLFKKDVLRLKKSKAKSYWIEKDKNKSEMKNQF
tara:strand:+ start:1852 stop:2256 length:405 start_codon:yes stop_codon:yes gene_type:complete